LNYIVYNTYIIKMVKKSISISIDEEIIDFLEKKAIKENRSISFLFNEILSSMKYYLKIIKEV